MLVDLNRDCLDTIKVTKEESYDCTYIISTTAAYFLAAK